jgi:two-component system NtrC family sensor kinase
MGRFKPKFWDHEDVAAGPFKHLFNFRRIWKLAVALTAGVALIPLVLVTMTDYNVTQHAIESEVLLRTSRLVSNTRRTVSFFLAERKSALDFIVRDNSFETLNEPRRLAQILQNLKRGFGGFVDLGVIDALGGQRTYVGPYTLEGKDYSDQEWFRQVLDRGVYISDVFLGFRHEPHLVIALKHKLQDGSFYVLRATLDTERFKDLLSQLEVSGMGDAFIINHEGTLQTPSQYHGKVLEKISLSIPEFSTKTEVLEEKGPKKEPLLVGYAYIADTPFILMIVKQKAELMKPWYTTRTQLLWFLAGSVTVILLVILGVATYLVNKIHTADQKRVMTLHQVEYSNKMASLGRLAAGVAHEINNPLAIINEKAGLIKDLFTLKKEYAENQKLMGIVDSVLGSVNRCATITRRLLNFARHQDVNIQALDVKEVIQDVLGFLGKEAEYRSIAISVKAMGDIPPLEGDRGRLQEIFLNLFNNAFAALSDGGHLDISIRRQAEDAVSVKVADDGCGISENDLKRVFEPFFSTRVKKGGTGLGLSITYGLVREIGGDIEVQSELGVGTAFTVTLPLRMKKKESELNASITGG